MFGSVQRSLKDAAIGLVAAALVAAGGLALAASPATTHTDRQASDIACGPCPDMK